MKKKKLDLILIDSFQNEYYQYCPFLSQLKQDNFSADLLPIIGYQQQLASLFTGKYPQEVDVWNTFWLSSRGSIFNWTRLFSFAKFLDRRLFKYFIDFLSYFFAGINDMSPILIPIEIMSRFDIIMRRPITYADCLRHPTIFDLLRNNNIKFSYFKGGIKHTDQSGRFLSNLSHLISRSDSHCIESALNDSADFKFIYLAELDHVVHKYGVDSLQVEEKLKELDSLIEKYIEESRRPFIIISDHGMIKVKQKTDILSRLGKTGLVMGRDYLVFLESVIARFWFFNDEARAKIINELENIKEGHILSESEKQEFGINFKDNKFGDLFFILEPGYVIIPNYYQSKTKPEAMHGYLPQFNKGIFLTNLKIDKQIGTINFVDVIPIVADFLGFSSKNI